LVASFRFNLLLVVVLSRVIVSWSLVPVVVNSNKSITRSLSVTVKSVIETGLLAQTYFRISHLSRNWHKRRVRCCLQSQSCYVQISKHVTVQIELEVNRRLSEEWEDILLGENE
jgi:hypothetical protein